jgi:hypothetical protein
MTTLNITQDIIKKSPRTVDDYAYNVVYYEGGEILVLDDKCDKVLAYTPAKTTRTLAEFQEDFTEGDTVEAITALEGTQIGMFWNPDLGKWEIYTRNGIGGRYSYMRPSHKDERVPTFREMVVDAFRVGMVISGQVAQEDAIEFETIHQLDTMNKECCYLYILKHSDNHIVYPTERFMPFLKLVAVYRKSQEGDLVSFQELPLDSDEWFLGRLLLNIHTPEIVELDNKAALVGFQSERLAEYARQTEGGVALRFDHTDLCNVDQLYYPSGWILKNRRTGHVCEMANPFYATAKERRNIQPNMRYLYLSLFTEDKVDEYLDTFPKYWTEFMRFKDEIVAFADKIYEVYVNYYILKNRTEKYPKKYFVHAAGIHHDVYLKSVFENNRRKITQITVVQYLKGISATKLFYYLTTD